MANTKIGKVVAKSGHKTITVLNVVYKNHPLYRKRYVQSKKYLVHDEKDQAKIDDRVVIKQSRPMSRRKRWTLLKVVSAGQQVEVQEVLADETVVIADKVEESPLVEPATKDKPVRQKTARVDKKPKDKPEQKTTREEESA